MYRGDSALGELYRVCEGFIVSELMTGGDFFQGCNGKWKKVERTWVVARGNYDDGRK